MILTASLKRTEALRGGAAALYGSDAIAGVINLQLKDDIKGVTASSTVGQTTKSDGGVLQVDTNIGIGLDCKGYLDLSGQYQNHGQFNRGLPDTAPLIYLGSGGQYPDRIIQNPRNDPDNFSVDPALSYNSSLDNTNRGRFVYNASQFGFQGAFYFGRVNVSF